MSAALSLQRTVGNAAVGAMLARGSPGLAALTVQRSPDDVIDLVAKLQGRLPGRKGPGGPLPPGFEAAALKIVAEVEAFALGVGDAATRTELRNRVSMMRDSLLSEQVTPLVKTRIEAFLSQLGQVSKDSPASLVWVALTDGSAQIAGLQTRWYASRDDKAKSGYSTAYNMGAGCKWEIHAHRNARGAASLVSVQTTSTVGTAQRYQRPLTNVDKLEAIGVPKAHLGDKKVRDQVPYDRWGPL